jgi:hypothetical protein
MRTSIAAVALLLAVSACGNDEPATSGAPSSPTSTATSSAQPEFSLPPFPDAWADTVDNPWFPLTPGSRWTYRSTSSEGSQRDVVEVTDRTKVVDGVTATVVHDRVWDSDGTLVEDTFDWYAQDADGNVWYLGEDTTSYEDGKASTEGSWEAGVDGAKAGILMLADPQVGDSYQQEYY